MSNNSITGAGRVKWLLTFICSFLLFHHGYSQARWQADVSITSVNITVAGKRIIKPQENVKTVETKTDDNLKCSITIHNENDDDARGTMMLVVLPVEVSVVSLPSNAVLDPSVSSSQPFAGYIIFNLGQMAVQQNITVEFTFTKSKYGNKVGAYAYSDSPDPNPANNYKDATY
jgi:hypothetical protein